MGNQAATNSPRWKRNKSILVTCANCGKETKKYVSQISKTRVGTTGNINKFENHYCSRKCYLEAKARGMSLPDQRGEKNPFWKNGASAVQYICEKCGKEFVAATANNRRFCGPSCWYDSISKPDNGALLRRGPGYYSWRAHTIHKSNGVCAGCGGAANHAHHVLPIAEYPGLRANKQNGMPLCESCHRWIHGKNSGGLVAAENSYLKDIVRYNEMTLGMSNQPGRGPSLARYFTRAGSEDSRRTGRIPPID